MSNKLVPTWNLPLWLCCTQQPPWALQHGQCGAQSPRTESKSSHPQCWAESSLSVRSREPQNSEHRFTPQRMQPELMSTGFFPPSGTPFTEGRHRRLIQSPVVRKSFAPLEKHPTSNPRPCHSCPIQWGKTSRHICCHRYQRIWCQVYRGRFHDTGLMTRWRHRGFTHF